MTTIRLWRVGYINPNNLCDSILPTKEALQKLRDLIATEDGKGSNVLDIIWGPDINLTVYTYPDDTDVVDVIQSAGDSQ
jgi:hypothetical protein